MLNEGDRLIRPEQIVQQIDLKELEGIVCLCLGKKGEQNTLFMSTVTIEELCLLSKQLDAHITCMMGMMKEG